MEDFQKNKKRKLTSSQQAKKKRTMEIKNLNTVIIIVTMATEMLKRMTHVLNYYKKNGLTERSV